MVWMCLKKVYVLDKIPSSYVSGIWRWGLGEVLGLDEVVSIALVIVFVALWEEEERFELAACSVSSCVSFHYGLTQHEGPQWMPSRCQHHVLGLPSLHRHAPSIIHTSYIIYITSYIFFIHHTYYIMCIFHTSHLFFIHHTSCMFFIHHYVQGILPWKKNAD